MKKQRIAIVACIIIILVVTGLALWQPSISLNDTEIEIGKVYRYSDIVSNISYGKLTSDEEFSFDTIGNKSLTFELENLIGVKYQVNCEIEVLDLEAPVIEGYKDYYIFHEFDEYLDISDGITVKDNSNEVIQLVVEGNYDTNVLGVYPVELVAIDSSQNISKIPVYVIVEQEMSIDSKYELNYECEFFTTEKGFVGYTHDGITFVEGIIMANKTYGLPYYYGNGLTKATNSAYLKMRSDGTAAGINIWILSGFRDFNMQYRLYDYWYNLQGQEVADTHSARAGHSEHQTGMAIDFNSVKVKYFRETEEYAWLKENCYKYGFCLRYIDGKTDETGYAFEPWHYRYVGIDLATKLYNGGDWITVEDYFGLTSEYNYQWADFVEELKKQ